MSGLKIQFLVLIIEIKTDLTLKRSNFLFLLCFKIAIIQFIPMHQPSGQRHNFFLAVLHQIGCFQHVY